MLAASTRWGEFYRLSRCMWGLCQGLCPDGAPKTGTISESVSVMPGKKNLSTYLNIHKQDSGSHLLGNRL